MEERQLVKPQNHRLVINNRKTGTVTGVLDVLSFDLNEILLETEQGMLMVKGTDMHVNRLNLEKGEVDLAGNIGISDWGLRSDQSGWRCFQLSL